MQKTFDCLAVMAYCGLIFWLSAQERLPVPALFDVQDKLLHFLAYAGMGILSVRANRHWSDNRQRLIGFAVLFCSLYGLSDEWHQSFVPGREPSAWDWLADSLGGLAGASVMSAWHKFRTA